MLNSWQMSSLTLQGITDQATKRAINKWLDDFEVIFRRNVKTLNQLSGYAGWVIGQMSGKNTGVISGTGIYAFNDYMETYSDFIRRLTNKDLTQAVMLRNNLAVVWKKDWKKFYESYDNFFKVSKSAGIPSKEIADRFLSKELSRSFTYLTDSAGRLWTPDNYARMYSATRNGEVTVDTTIERMKELEMDMVQVSDHNTTTPICSEYEGRIFSLTGATEGLPILDIKPPFHPNCKHILLPIKRKYSESDAIHINTELNKRYEVFRSDFTEAQMKQVNKQKDWNVSNRR